MPPTLQSLYVALPPQLRAAMPAGIEARARAWLRRQRRGTPETVPWLEARLWGGFSAAALPGLAALAAGPDPAAAGAAALALARWHAVAADWATALAAARLAADRDPGLGADRRQLMLEALFLCRLGRGAEARDRLAALGPGADDLSARLMRANGWNPACGAPDADPARMLAEINAVFRRAGLAEIAARDSAQPLSLDNLAPARALAAAEGPRVTVILPVWNAEATLDTALASLLGQTHGSLEILVVDDASTDASADLAADWARRDPRVRLIRQPENRGGYAARNRALGQATGEFVTVQDADDWSHPERIARHLADLQRRPRPFNISDWVRASSALAFWGTWRPAPELATRNFSSVFCRRELMERLGPWDTTRISADREFINRLQHLHRLPRQKAFLPGAPLAFGRSDERSLTRSAATHAATMYHGLRREYHEAMDFWHARLDRTAVRIQGLAARPPYFPVPRSLRSERSPDPGVDLLFIGDFNLQGGTQKSAMHMIAAARAAGRSAALLHYPRYDQDVAAPLAEIVRETAWASGVHILAPGESLAAGTVIVTYPPVFEAVMDRFPEVRHQRLAVVVNQMAERDLSRSDVAYDPARVRAHLAALLGSEGIWIPISDRVRALMAADPRYPAPWPETWTPLSDAVDRPALARWRGDRRRPVIGRHGRDHALKWPRDPAALALAYCAGHPCETRFLGGALTARQRLGRWPRNWRDDPFDARPVAEFLAGLDVFLHFPDPDYIEEFGRAPMEAMAAGVPVILPPEFAPTFGAAALYAAPDGVWPLVARLWADHAFWEARAAAGRAFVAAHCSYTAFPDRLDRLAAAEAPAPAAVLP